MSERVKLTEWIALLLNVVPFLEIRLALPVAVGLGFDPIVALLLCVLLNLAAIPIAFTTLDFVVPKLRRRVRVIDRLYRWSVRRARRHERLGAIGLCVFVGVPLPGSGAYSGALIAHVLGMQRRTAVAAIAAGVVIAGVILWASVTLGLIVVWRSVM
jgi:uncharacterized membrane protein